MLQRQSPQQNRYSSLPHHHSHGYHHQQDPDYSSAPSKHHQQHQLQQQHQHQLQHQLQLQQQQQRDLSPTTRQQQQTTATKQQRTRRTSQPQQQQQQQQQQHQQQNQQQLQQQQQQLQQQQYPELQIIFDFFTDNPQKVMPGDVNSPKKDSPFFDPYWESIRSMQENDNFLEGILLRSVDCKPRFPYVHYIVYKEGGTQRGRKSSEHQDNVLHEAEGDFIEVLKNRGAYKELHTFVDRETSLLPKRPSNPNTAYILSAFMTSGSNLESLDRTWSYWSGADYIVENIPPSLKLERITFHKMITSTSHASFYSKCQDNTNDTNFTSWPPQNGTSVSFNREAQTENSGTHHRFSTQPSPSQPQGASCSDARRGQNTGIFSYVLLCELGEALADVNRAREFIDHLKFRQCGISSLYVIDHFF